MASLGAGVTVAIAASACLLVVSAVVAFNGWPELGAAGVNPTAELPLAAPGSDRGVAAGAPRVAATSVLPTAAAANGSRTRRASSTPQRGTAPAAALTGSAVGAGTPARAASPTAAPAASPGHDSAGADAVRTTAGTSSDAVRQTATSVGVAVQPVSPQAGQSVEQTGDEVAGAVDAAGSAAGDALDQLTHP